jgi:plasmid maintenance system killer protein
MWTVRLEKAAAKVLEATTPDVRRRFDAWAAIVIVSGPQGLRAVKGMHDEKLAGSMKDLRSSRLGLHWRVIYRIDADIVTANVEQITPHVYRK